jgi:hypothetical protein
VSRATLRKMIRDAVGELPADPEAAAAVVFSSNWCGFPRGGKLASCDSTGLSEHYEMLETQQ